MSGSALKKPPLYLIADTNRGLGHIRRLQALEQEWGEAHWEFSDMPEIPGVVVIDNYYFIEDGFRAWQKAGHLVVCVTDFNRCLPANLLINPNSGSESLLCNTAIRLLGPKYFMLRKDYLTVERYGHGAIFDADSVGRKLSPLEFAQTMAESRAIICSAGQTAYEALYLEKPLFLRIVAENQRLTYENLIQKGYALPYNVENRKRIRYGWLPTLKPGRTMVDGLGVGRVKQAILMAWDNRSMASG